MRTISKSNHHFHGTHKGCEISIERERYPDCSGAFYITVTHKDGGYLYDGWSPPAVLTMAEAKREALCGSGLKERPPADHGADDRPSEASGVRLSAPAEPPLPAPIKSSEGDG